MKMKDFFQVMTEKREITSPVFTKPFTERPSHIKQLESLLKETDPNINRVLAETHLNLFRIGHIGESNVHFELNNSMLPLLCLHDVRLENRENTAQFDFIVISHSIIYVIETKKLYGDIEVTGSGEFIRKLKSKSGRVYKKEGMYSPVTQSERHARLLEKLLKENGLIKTMPVENLVVLANPKTILDKKKAPAEISKKIIRSDQLVKFIKQDLNQRKKKTYAVDNRIKDISKFILKSHKLVNFDKSRYMNVETAAAVETVPDVEAESSEAGKDSEKLYKELKAYRLEQAKKENVAAYLIYNNSTLEDIIEKMPSNKEELLKIRGFGKTKAEKYGAGILEIVRKN
ncbi:HRDC domain-containing protein [Evansella sp. LMS18]|uniref:HRDC domain-containing protein n=1 Tax=Evansella sp. LMS18 TaxID=2924033 RepID=UPI0020D0D361|nr:HRDC domain-containing protein [Evansella sp. LMS18]UTR10068.1 HRDC domain-containing protein [Evansella sp. LMS18]